MKRNVYMYLFNNRESRVYWIYEAWFSNILFYFQPVYNLQLFKKKTQKLRIMRVKQVFSVYPNYSEHSFSICFLSFCVFKSHFFSCKVNLVLNEKKTKRKIEGVKFFPIFFNLLMFFASYWMIDWFYSIFTASSVL